MAGGARLDEGGARGQVTTVFVSDPTAEAERVAQALRIGGYVVVDVPLSMLVARVAVQCPHVILIDADSDGALDAVSRMRELPDADAIHVVFIARPGGAVSSPEEALAHEGSGLFVRPVDVPALVRKVEALAGGPRSPSPIPSYSPDSSRRPPPREGQDGSPSLPPASMRAMPATPATPVPPATIARPLSGRSPSEPPASPGTASIRRVAGLAPPVSTELQQLLADAELRVQVRAETESMLPSPEDEIEAVLPAELLAALDEPMEADDDEYEVPAPAPRQTQGPQIARERTRDSGAPRTTGASTTGSGATPSVGRRATPERRSAPPPASTHTQGGTHAGSTGGGVSTTGSERRERAESRSPVGPAEGASRSGRAAPRDSPPPARLEGGEFPSVVGPGEAMLIAARAIASRTGGSLCFIEGAIERRVVLREGDIVTAASSREDESLLAFLGARGDLPRETVRRLSSKFPPYGRHAGAALVAKGYLGQDQMWPTLRAHAEWVLAHVLQMGEGRLVAEARPPGRLAGEPSVFGGSTGAEVFVELVRRIVAPADAIERLGGVGARVGEGAVPALLAECALGPEETDRLRASRGATLREALDGAPEGDLATVIFALTQLGVLEVLASIGAPQDEPDGVSAGDAALDADAIRERVRARAQLVDDGDYFAVLGVARDATGYEVRRAFLELRRAFDPVADVDPRSGRSRPRKCGRSRWSWRRRTRSSRTQRGEIATGEPSKRCPTAPSEGLPEPPRTSTITITSNEYDRDYARSCTSTSTITRTSTSTSTPGRVRSRSRPRVRARLAVHAHEHEAWHLEPQPRSYLCPRWDRAPAPQQIGSGLAVT